MRKILLFLISYLMIVTLTSCSLFTDKSNNSNNNNSQIIENNTTTNDGDNENNSQMSKSIVIYFSRTNNTEKVASYIVEIVGADKYEIEAKVPYTDDDIKYYTNCRADQEQNDPTARPEIKGESIDLTDYDIIYLGYPIWHGQAPKILYTFIESYNLTGKTIVPFCTSASSGIGSSATNLAQLTNQGSWKNGIRFSSNANKSEVENWINSLNLGGK